MSEVQTYDAVIIGGGIGGLIALRILQKNGVRSILLEGANEIGGLWRTLPEWQDIQTRKEDWSINGMTIRGEKQPEILENIRSYVTRYNLSPAIRLNARVSGLQHDAQTWSIQSKAGTIRARYVILATGIHNKPFVPCILRSQSQVEEVHSSNVREPRSLANKRVVIVGSGASALDCLDLALKEGARKVYWVYRSLRWFVPTLGRKYRASGLRALAFQQIWGTSRKKIDEKINEFLLARYRRFGLDDIIPERPFSFSNQMLIPGRAEVIRRLKDITRLAGEVSRIEGTEVFVGDQSIKADKLVWCTGFDTDLSWTGLPKFMEIKKASALAKKLGSLTLSLDYPNLFILGPGVLDTNSTTPWIYSILLSTVSEHIRGRCRIPAVYVDPRVNHWETLSLLAQFDHKNYGFGWRWKAVTAALFYKRFEDWQVRTGV